MARISLRRPVVAVRMRAASPIPTPSMASVSWLSLGTADLPWNVAVSKTNRQVYCVERAGCSVVQRRGQSYLTAPARTIERMRIEERRV